MHYDQISGPHPVLGTVITVILFAASAFLGFVENLDLMLSVIAKMTAIGAGLASILVAYKTYKRNDRLHDKGDSGSVS